MIGPPAPTEAPAPADPDPRIAILKKIDHLQKAKEHLDAALGPMAADSVPVVGRKLKMIQACVRALEPTKDREFGAAEIGQKIDAMSLNVRGEVTPKSVYAALNKYGSKSGISRNEADPKNILWALPSVTARAKGVASR